MVMTMLGVVVVILLIPHLEKMGLLETLTGLVFLSGQGQQRRPICSTAIEIGGETAVVLFRLRLHGWIRISSTVPSVVMGVLVDHVVAVVR
ncbi:hypothetical protein Acr_03g0019310 [Actinidia rufa]|uniref:Secreted protein n=1 Tax=Actinidia rufa TaxID=165716 RepID=A0A7J0EHP5_9ERIC|nr:hypothetical protein Acr_03g0019310 [Actinidia rufa]